MGLFLVGVLAIVGIVAFRWVVLAFGITLGLKFVGLEIPALETLFIMTIVMDISTTIIGAILKFFSALFGGN